MEMGPSERKGKALEKFVLELEKRLNDKIRGIYSGVLLKVLRERGVILIYWWSTRV